MTRTTRTVIDVDSGVYTETLDLKEVFQGPDGAVPFRISKRRLCGGKDQQNDRQHRGHHVFHRDGMDVHVYHPPFCKVRRCGHETGKPFRDSSRPSKPIPTQDPDRSRRRQSHALRPAAWLLRQSYHSSAQSSIPNYPLRQPRETLRINDSSLFSKEWLNK